MIRTGPRKLVLIRSGGYAYAEIDLDHSMHIVGENNVGKTTIVNALQYLFVDDERSMRFPENAEASRKHYFGDQASMILYECQTTQRGRVVVGIRPLGPAQGYRYERFVYDGSYRMSDFIGTDNVPVSWEVVSKELALRNLQSLQPKDLRGALTGRSGPVDLSMIPLRGGVDYAVFRRGFVNLLRLTKITGIDLKDFLVEICQGDGNFHPVIDITNEYATGFEQAQAAQLKAQDLRHALPTVQEVCEAIVACRTMQRRATASWRSIAHSDAHHRATLNDSISNNLTLRDNLSQIEVGLNAIITKNVTTLARLNIDIAVRREQMEEIHARREKLIGIDAAALQADAELQGRKVANLQDSMRRSEGRDPVEIEAEIGGQRAAIANLRRRIDTIDDGSMLDWLSDRYAAAQIETISRVINQELLSLSVPRHLCIRDEDALAARIDAMLASIVEDRFDTDMFEIDISHIRAVDMARRPDRKALERQLIELEEQLARLEADLLAARNRQRQMDELRAEEKKHREQLRLLAEIQRLADDLAGMPAREDEVGRLADERDGVQLANDKSQDEHQQLSGRIKSLEAAISDDRTRIDTLARLMRTVDACTGDQDDDAVPDLIPLGAMQSTVSAYERQLGQLRQLEDDVAKGRGRLAESLYALPVEHDALLARLETFESEAQSQIRASDLAWTSLVGSMTTSFTRLEASLETIRRRATTINTELRKVNVSNLEGLRLKVTENVAQVRTLREFLATRTSADDMFSDPGAHKDASQRIQQMIGRGSWSIEDLFQVEIEIVKNGKPRVYASIDNIESNGTSITIKIVLGIVLLHGLLRIEAMSIPFYIDEATALDEHNLRQIIAFAETKGFVPILASPHPSRCVHTYYYPVADEHGAYIIPAHHRVIRTEQPALAAQ